MEKTMGVNNAHMQEMCVEKMKHIRKVRGMTQEEFAEELGMSLSAYKKIEEKVNSVSLDLLCQLKKITGISIDYMLSANDGDVERAWAMIEICTEYEKLELLTRLIDYFGRPKMDELIYERKESLLKERG